MGPHSDDFVGVVAILVIFGLPLSYAIIQRYLSHQERMEMMRRGIAPPDPRWAKKMGAQTGQSVPPPYPGYDPYAYNYGAERQLRRGVSLTMCGLALFIGLSFIRPGHVGPWLLGGLIPLFVGLGQVFTAMLNGARLGPFGFGPPSGPNGNGGRQAFFTPPPYGAQPPPSAPPPPSGPYAWRPGATTELERPVQPPDVK